MGTPRAATRFPVEMNTGGRTMTDRNADKPVRQQAEEQREQLKKHGDKIHVASDDSFPASDPPSFTPGTGEKKNDIKKKAKQDAD
jgi:hypothetical protein